MDGCSEDVPGLAHWWSNCLHLRWMLWAMCRGDDDAGLDDFDWVMQVRHRDCNVSKSVFGRALCFGGTNAFPGSPEFVCRVGPVRGERASSSRFCRC